MPASATAERIAGETQGAGYHNATAIAHPHLLWLGDLIPVPGPLPNVISIGDCIIFAGMLVLHTAPAAGQPGRGISRSNSRISHFQAIVGRQVGSPEQEER